MGDIINLRRARKAKARDLAATEAAENRRLSGLTKAERQAADAEKKVLERALDQARLQRD